MQLIGYIINTHHTSTISITNIIMLLILNLRQNLRLWQRAEHLYGVCGAFVESPYVQIPSGSQ